MRSIQVFVFVLAGALLHTGSAGADYSKRCTNGVCRIEKNGEVTWTGDPEKVAAMKEKEAEAARREEKRRKKIQEGPKRKAGEPIKVAILKTELGTALESAAREPDAIFDGIYEAFEGDDVLQLKGKKSMNKAKKEIEWNRKRTLSSKRGTFVHEAKQAGVRADVYVHTFANLEEMVGYSKQKKKLAKGVQLVIRAKVSSGYIYEEHEVVENGGLFHMTEVMEKLAARVTKKIKDDIRPTLPALPKAGEKKSINLKDLFKKK